MRKLCSLIVLLIIELSVNSPSTLLAQEEPAPEKAPVPSLTGGPLTLHETALITLANSTNIEKAIEGVKGAWVSHLGSQAEFDFYTSLSAHTSETTYTEDLGVPDGNYRGFTGAINKRFRTGISSSLSVSTNRSDLTDLPNEASNSATTSASLTFPLLKGRGYVSAAAGETSARLKAEAADFDFFHQVSGFLLEAVKAYWNYKAAVERLKIQRTAEQMVQRWIADAGTGIQPGQYKDETAQLDGYLNYKRKNTLAAMEEVTATKGQLASVMGVPFEQMKKIGEPAEIFPEDWQNVLTKLEHKSIVNEWVDIAMQHRLDLKAIKRHEQASAVALAKAEHDILPQLDLGLNYNFNGIKPGDAFNYHIDAIDSDTHSSTTGANLNFSYPIENSGARAAREGARIGYRISKLTTSDSERQVGIGVSVATDTVLGKLKTAVEAKKTVESYLPAIQKLSNVNLKSNPQAIFDFINLEKRYNEAQASPAPEENSYVNSLRDLAIAIAELRHQTGTLVIGGEIGKDVALGNLTMLPTADPAEPSSE